MGMMGVSASMIFTPARVQAVAHVLADVKQLPRQLRVRLQVAQRRRGDGDIRGGTLAEKMYGRELQRT